MYELPSPMRVLCTSGKNCEDWSPALEEVRFRIRVRVRRRLRRRLRIRVRVRFGRRKGRP